MTNSLYPVARIGSTSQEFRVRLVEVSDELTIDPTDLAAIISFESGFDPKIRNRSSGATGLIQWLPSTARDLYGLSVAQIAQMSAVEQLELVLRYFAGIKGRRLDLHQLYMLVWNGSAAPADKVLGVADAPGHPGAVYRQNAGLDLDKDGRITAGEASAIVRSIATAARRLPPLDLDGGYDPKAPASTASSSPSGPLSSSAPSRIYRVRAGDTPFILACRLTGKGRRWKELYTCNPRAKIDLLIAGYQLQLPEGWRNA